MRELGGKLNSECAVGLANWQPSDPKILSLSMLVKIPRYFCDSKPRNQVLDMFLAWRVPLQCTRSPPDASLAYPSPLRTTLATLASQNSHLRPSMPLKPSPVTHDSLDLRLALLMLPYAYLSITGVT
jgi:hypothetical protein